MDACAGWLVQGDALVERAHRGGPDHLSRACREDWLWGTVTARRRLLHRTAVVAAVADDDTALADVGRLCHDLRDSMARHWPDVAATVVPTTRTHLD